MKISHLFFLALSLSTTAVRACDLCGCYTPTREALQDSTSGFYFGFAEQFTSFSKLTFDGHQVDNPTGQSVNSLNSQAVLGDTFWHQRLGLQLNVPWLYREYRRPEGFAIEHGSVSGLGDLTVQANAVLWRTEPVDVSKTCPLNLGKDQPILPPVPVKSVFSGSLNLIAGVKLPTGDSSRLKENFSEEDLPGAPANAIGGHDLALGTGSVDGVFGLQLELHGGDLFFQADTQYTWRGQGDYSYRYANDLTWSGGPGWTFFHRQDRSLALQAVLSGETKGYDHFQGVADPDTGATALYAGPRLVAAWGRINGEIGIDLPVVMHSTQLQATAEYRLRAGFSIQF